MNKKTLIIFAITIAIGSLDVTTAFATTDANTITQVISNERKTIAVELNNSTVKFSSADYTTPTLKVLIPNLSQVTVLNHRNFSEGAPCLRIESQNINVTVDDILKVKSGSTRIPMQITRTVLKTLTDNPKPNPNPDASSSENLNAKICLVKLRENIAANINGFLFVHTREISLPSRVSEDCR